MTSWSENRDQENMISAILLAGGKSSRMGRDKAFLEYDPGSFIYRIASEMLKISDDLMVVIGKKDKTQFEHALEGLKGDGPEDAFDQRLRILNDQYDLQNPLGGMLTGFVNARNRYAAIVGCDMPLIKSSVFEYLYSHVFGYDCCIPINEENHNVEPLCSVYNVKRSIEASFLAIEDGKVGPKHFVSYLSRVNYVPISKIRAIDPNLDSIVNINYPREYAELLLQQRSRNDQRGGTCTSQTVPLEPVIFSHRAEDSFERTQQID